jgi:DNA-binding NtrC family response regulator
MNSATILVIDDEAQIRKLLSITLQSFDYRVL